MPLSARRAVRPTALLAVAAVSAGLVFAPGSASSAPPEAQAAQHKRVGPPTVKMVTLVTGDVVKVSRSSDGRQSVTLQPRPDGSIPQAAIRQVHDHVYVVPSEALGLLEANRLDHDLFDVTALIEAEYDDASRESLPVMVDYGKGAKAAQESRSVLPGGRRAHRDRASARHRGVPRREGGRPCILGRPHPGRGRCRQPDRPGRRRRARRPRRPRRGGPGGLGPPDPRPRGVGGRLRRRRHHRGGAGHRLRPDAPRPPGSGGGVGQLHDGRLGHRRQRPRHPRRLDGRRERCRVRRAPQGRGPEDRPDGRQGPERRRLG